MKVTTFGDLLHHMINKTNFDSESDFVTAHALVDEKYPAEATLVSRETEPAEAQTTGETPAEAQTTGETPAEAQTTGGTPAEAQTTGGTPAEAQTTSIPLS